MINKKDRTAEQLAQAAGVAAMSSSATQRVDVARLSELLEKATPGPWSARENHFSRWEILGGRGILANVATPNDPASPPESWRECEANAALIAEAITSLPALLQQLAELQDCLRYANRANATIKTMCSSAESKLAERDAEAALLRNGAEQEKLNLLTQLHAAERAREGDRAELAKFERECRIYQGQHERAYADHQMDGRESYHHGRALANTFKWMGGRIAAFLAANGGRDETK